jgi:phosphoglycerate dehydrogenase-like enzyme
VVSYVPSGYDLTVLGREATKEQQIDAVKDADFLLCYRMDLLDEVVRAAEKCRLVQLLAAGYDGVNLTLLRELEIPCANNGGANSWAVSDHALLLMLSIYKQLLAIDPATRQGRWNEPITGQNTFEMAGKKVGVLGIGNIGKQVAKRVQAFDAQVQYYDLYPLDEEIDKSLGVTYVSLEELFRTSDIITCHTPLTKDTHHIVNAERLAMMKSSAILINTSRGPVVDEQALIEALELGVIAGAGLDVFEQEPVDPHNPLLTMTNVVATPHMAGTTWDTWARRAQFGFKNMERIRNGESPQAVVRDFNS